ncbi:hypothetical protein F5Y14DRAFT_454238 [Nemania sp. NC0429]|nr:hypothetical protein F5Y14DRAFT_454238 [Nemania sp. NC0429]
MVFDPTPFLEANKNSSGDERPTKYRHNKSPWAITIREPPTDEQSEQARQRAWARERMDWRLRQRALSDKPSLLLPGCFPAGEKARMRAAAAARERAAEARERERPARERALRAYYLKKKRDEEWERRRIAYEKEQQLKREREQREHDEAVRQVERWLREPFVVPYRYVLPLPPPPPPLPPPDRAVVRAGRFCADLCARKISGAAAAASAAYEARRPTIALWTHRAREFTKLVLQLRLLLCVVCFLGSAEPGCLWGFPGPFVIAVVMIWLSKPRS